MRILDWGKVGVPKAAALKSTISEIRNIKQINYT